MSRSTYKGLRVTVGGSLGSCQTFCQKFQILVLHPKQLAWIDKVTSSFKQRKRDQNLALGISSPVSCFFTSVPKVLWNKHLLLAKRKSVSVYSFLLRKPSAKPSALLCPGAFVHYSRNEASKRVCQCESFFRLACVGMPTSCGLAVVLFSLGQVSQWGSSLPCRSLHWFWSMTHIDNTQRPPKQFLFSTSGFKVLTNFFPLFYKSKLIFH